jgi:amino acid transporter
LGGPRPRVLRRALGLPLLIFYGLGTIIGAGIYVLVGEVAGHAGMAAPLSFLIAGGLAAMTGLGYAELVARHPEAASAAVYVGAAFRSDLLSRVVGLAVALVAAVAGASIASGSVGYLQTFVPIPHDLAVVLIVGGFTVIACVGVVESVGFAAVFTALEIGGLLLVIAVGVGSMEAAGASVGELQPATEAAWGGVAAGAFLAFFAYVGFESLANMAEESRDVGTTLPRAILISIALSTLLYASVSLVAVLALPLDELAGATAPLARVVAPAGSELTLALSAIAVIATTNGVLIEILTIARLAYGMGRRRWLPGWFGAVSSRTRTPVRATLVAGGAILALALAFPFATLVAATSSITLAIFIAVNLALMRLHRSQPRPDLAIRAPRWLPPAATLACAALLLAQLLG